MTTTENQGLPVRSYIPQYRNILSTVFEAKKAFAGALAPIQTLDGIRQNATAFTVKTSSTPVVIGEYKTDANTAFGTGTSKSSRFGEMKEVIYEDTEVKYLYDLVINEGLDRHTVNNDLNAAIADRFKLQAIAQTRHMNVENGKYLADSAGETMTLSDHKEETIKKLFNELDSYYTDSEVIAPITAYLTAEVYNAIVDMPSVTSSKGSGVNIDSNGLAKYKDFKLEKTPSRYFPKGVEAILAPDNVVIPFVGIETARTVEPIDFDGVALQAAAKGGEFILDDNKKAVVKVTKASL